MIGWLQPRETSWVCWTTNFQVESKNCLTKGGKELFWFFHFLPSSFLVVRNKGKKSRSWKSALGHCFQSEKIRFGVCTAFLEQKYILKVVCEEGLGIRLFDDISTFNLHLLSDKQNPKKTQKQKQKQIRISSKNDNKSKLFHTQLFSRFWFVELDSKFVSKKWVSVSKAFHCNCAQSKDKTGTS